MPEGEREVICQIFASKCFSVELLGRVVDMITGYSDPWVKSMAIKEYGLADPRSKVLAAISTFAAFIECGLVPLVSYLIAGGRAPPR